MTRKCPRTLDKPVLLMGLEPEDVGVLSLIVGLLSIFLGPMIPGMCGIGGWVVLVRFKRGKPAGYMMHRLYVLGLDLPGLLPARTTTYAIWSQK